MRMKLSLSASSTSSTLTSCSYMSKSAQLTANSFRQFRTSVMGWMISFMINNLLKFGKNCVVLLDATFGTNHLKMPLYLGIVMDNFGNGVPGFMTLCQGTSQPDITQWLTALLQRVRKEDPEWMCSCVMVDDAIAEINLIK